LLALFVSLPCLSHAQTPLTQFEVVSIKRHAGSTAGFSVGMRMEPDGTQRLTNVPMSLAVTRALPVLLRDVIGLPDWVNDSERYDIIVKPPEGAGRPTRDQEREMWRSMFEDRMKLAFHVEQRERDVYTLVVARPDGKLGSDLKPSTLDCKSVPPLSFNGQMPGVEFFQRRCGIGGTPSAMASGGVTLDQFAAWVSGVVGAAVENRTELEGLYGFTLTFSRQRSAAPSVNPTASDDLPDVFTAVQEQLGLKLQHGKKMLPIYVIDHIERPSDN
jgi:uncharacterized protein (TIGR03435 family)